MTIKKEMGEKADEIRNLIAEWYPKENIPTIDYKKPVSFPISELITYDEIP